MRDFGVDGEAPIDECGVMMRNNDDAAVMPHQKSLQQRHQQPRPQFFAALRKLWLPNVLFAYKHDSQGYLNRLISRLPLPTSRPYLSVVRLVCGSYSPRRLPYLSRKTCFEPIVWISPIRLPVPVPQDFTTFHQGSLPTNYAATEPRSIRSLSGYVATASSIEFFSLLTDAADMPASRAVCRTPLPAASAILAFSNLDLAIGGLPNRTMPRTAA